MGFFGLFVANKIRIIATSLAAMALVPMTIYATYRTVQYFWLKKDNAILRISLDNVRNLRAAERRGYETAQQQAELKAKAEKARLEASYNAERERKNHELSKARTAVRIAADRYADANSVRIPCPAGAAANSIRAGGADLPEPADTTIIVDGQRCHTSMVAVSRDDFNTLVDNTTRLYNAHKWAVQFKAE